MHDSLRHPRVEEVAVVTYEDITGGEDSSDRLHEQPCWLRDLSEGGALLEVSARIEPSTRIVLHLTLPSPQGDDLYLRVVGETRWITGENGSRPHRVGVKFEDLAEQDAAALRSFMAARGTPE